MTDTTPNDIVNKAFRVTFRGYAPQEVDDFLQNVSDSLFHALEENRRLKSQLDEQRGRVQQYQETESLMTNALLLAQRTADDLRHQAHQEADLLRREAQQLIRAEYATLDDLRQTRQRVIAEIRAVLQSHLLLLDAQAQQAAPPGSEAR